MDLPRDIPTAITDAEAAALFQVASDRKLRTGRCRVLELGSQYGFSTVLLAGAADLVVAVDWHRGDPHAGPGDSLPTYWENINRYHLQDKVISMVGPAETTIPLLADRQYQVAFIDAFHEAESVYRDARLLLPKLTPNATLVFHDYGRFTVKPAVDQIARETNARFTLVETLAILELP